MPGGWHSLNCAIGARDCLKSSAFSSRAFEFCHRWRMLRDCLLLVSSGDNFRFGHHLIVALPANTNFPINGNDRLPLECSCTDAKCIQCYSEYFVRSGSEFSWQFPSLDSNVIANSVGRCEQLHIQLNLVRGLILLSSRQVERTSVSGSEPTFIRSTSLSK